MLKSFASLVLVLVTGFAAQAADSAPGEMAWEKACAGDMKKLCDGQPGDVRSCLAKHEKQLSKGCTQHFSAAGYRVALLCDKDFARLCKAETEGKGDLAKCVNAKQAQLSPKCLAALSNKPEPADAPAATAAAPAPKKGKSKK